MLLWRTLADMPVNYCEPLVLFYREHQSMSEVAAQLDLSEDTVKQRLSRGRAKLREELTDVVEFTLTRTRPTGAFTVAVLAALPVLAPTGAEAAVFAGVASSKGVGAAKAVLAKWFLYGAHWLIFLIVSWLWGGRFTKHGSGAGHPAS